MNNDFISQKPRDPFLSTLVDYYFFIDIPVHKLEVKEEYVLPFPRITFGYFFSHPFLVTNHDKNETRTVDMVISRISTDKITVQPQSHRIKIIGAHVRPYVLAYLTDQSIGSLPWLINTEELFKEHAIPFKQQINSCNNPEQMFEVVEQTFLGALLDKDLSLISRSISLIEQQSGDIKLNDVANQVGVTDRSLRNQFYKYVGCTPKEYIQLVKLKQSVYQMRYSSQSLTDITYDNSYFDQAHFVNSMKQVTGQSPKDLRKDLPHFRFLQF